MDRLERRLGMVAFAASGVLTALTIVVRGPFIDPAYTPDQFAQAGASTGWIAYSVGTMISIWLSIYGFVALYAYLKHVNPKVQRPAFWGMVLTIGIILLMPGLGVYAVAGPVVSDIYKQNPQLGVDISKALGTPLYLATVLIQAVLYCIGSLLLGIAIWRSGTLPKWCGAFFFLQAPLIQFIPLVSYPGELLGALMLAVSSVWIAWGILRAVDLGLAAS